MVLCLGVREEGGKEDEKEGSEGERGERGREDEKEGNEGERKGRAKDKHCTHINYYVEDICQHFHQVLTLSRCSL